jgi:hypothetical protein
MDLCSEKLSKDLHKIGCMQNKTFKVKFPALPDNILRHFVRGYFDGDGCVSYSYPKRDNIFGNSFIGVVRITGTEAFCISLQEYIKQFLSLTSSIGQRREATPEIKTLSITGNQQVITFLEWLYHDSNLFLRRKYERYLFIQQEIEKRLKVHRPIQQDHMKKVANVANTRRATMIHLSSIVKNTTERWNARYFMTHGIVKCEKKSLFTKEQAEILRQKLDQYGEKDAIPEKLVEEEFIKARKIGFPYYQFSKIKFLQAVRSMREAKIIKKDSMYSWIGNGSAAASFFHPHMFECRRKGSMSALEFFNSDEDFRRGIWKLIALYKNITESNIREICRNEKASSRINNFPPRVAMAVLQELFPSAFNISNLFDCEEDKRIRVLDPCAGFSGRLLGCVCSSRVKEYNGIDLSKKTYNGLLKTKDWLGNCDVGINLVHGDCLTKMKKFKNMDLILTSTPFLDSEQYVGVPFETDYDKWLEGFINQFTLESYKCLRPKGKMAVYLEKIQSKRFPDDFGLCACNNGFKQIQSVRFKMSYGENMRDKKEARGVPVLIFEKQ